MPHGAGVAVVELHALGEGQAMLVVCVSRGDAARLSDPQGSAQDVFMFYGECGAPHPVLVGIPTSRITCRWESRTRDFGVIELD